MDVEIREVHGEELAAALAVEETVFKQQEYPYDYECYNQQSVLLGAFVQGQCVGALRLIAQTPIAPPVLLDCTVWEPEQWQQLGLRFEELGTVAVLPEYEKQGIGFMLYASAYGNARLRGVTHWGIVMEPFRVDILNTNFHFTFFEVGDMGYKGWDCTPNVMVLLDTERNLFENDPAMYEYASGFFRDVKMFS